MRRKKRIPIRDKLCLLGAAALIVTAAVLDTAIVEADRRAVEAQPPAVTAEYPVQLSTLAEMPIAEALEVAEADFYRAGVPLSPELQTALWDVCEAQGVPVSLALGLIEVESGFEPQADNGLCYGLCQLNKRYYPEDLSPAENIAAGVAHLAGQLERYDGDVPAALTAYNAGHDTGSRTYANAVLAAAGRWENE